LPAGYRRAGCLSPIQSEELQKPRAAPCARKSAAPQQRGMLDFSA
jgi:hypothetical protein